MKPKDAAIASRRRAKTTRPRPRKAWPESIFLTAFSRCKMRCGSRCTAGSRRVDNRPKPDLDVIRLRVLSGLGSSSTRRLGLARFQPCALSQRGGFVL